MALQKVQPARESVPSRLGQLAPGVERDLLDPLAEALAEMDGECIPCMHQNGPFGRIAANAGGGTYILTLIVIH